MKINVNVRIRKKWNSVRTEWKNYCKWVDFAFKKWEELFEQEKAK